MHSRIMLFLIAVLLLSGCASTKPSQNPKELSSTHGYLFVNFPRYLGVLTLRNESGKKFTLDTDYNSEVGGLWLPEGVYSLDNISTFLGRNKLSGYPPVDIKSGRITDMGSLINFPVGELKTLWLPIKLESANKLITNKAVELSQFISSEDPLSWRPTKLPKISDFDFGSPQMGGVVGLIVEGSMRNNAAQLQDQLTGASSITEFYDTAVKLLQPLKLSKPVRGAQNSLYFGLELGFIKKRSQSGAWSTTHVGSHYPIISLGKTQETILAGNSNGKLFESSDTGNSWRQISDIGEDQYIFDIEVINNEIFLLTGTPFNPVQRWGPKLKLNVYVLNKNAASMPKLIKAIEYESTYGRPPVAEIFGNTYFIGIDSGNMEKYETKLGTWTPIDTPKDFTGFNISKKDNTITLFYAAGIFSKLYLSDDLGDTWAKISSPNYIIEDVHFYSLSDGYAYRTNMLLASNVIQKFNIKKNKWIDVSVAPDTCKYLLPDEHNLYKFCIAKGGDILLFKDNAWIPEVIK